MMNSFDNFKIESAKMANMQHNSGGTGIQRIASIDILRALTMVLMIFVNDLWSLENIPSWLGHVEAGVDGIGLADVVFPAFLFIVGLSLPYAINNRRKKGDTDWQLVKHVLLRSFALIVMGVFLVNGESFNAEATGMVKRLWYPLCCLSFILVWNSYPDAMNKYLVWILKLAGVITLVTLGILYRGGEEDNLQYFAPHWWGILGLIGWSYLVSGLITVFARNNFSAILGGWIFFCVLSIIGKADLLPHSRFISAIPDAIRGGTLTGLTMGGVLTSYVFQYFVNRQDKRGLTITFLLFSAIQIGLALITRPYWGLAKLGATPAWLFLCSAFTILTFLIVYWVADVWGKARWFDLIKPAGMGTLLCYLIPYFAYAFTGFLHIHLPEAVLSGPIGLVKSFLFALLCVFITGGLLRLGLRLRL